MKKSRYPNHQLPASKHFGLLAGIMFLIILLPLAVYLARTPRFAHADSYVGFNEGYGDTAHDASGNISGSVTGVTWVSDGCLDGKCLSFDGSGDYVSFGDPASGALDFAAADIFTISLWFRHAPISSGTQVLFAKANGTAGGYKVYLNSNGTLTFAIDDDATWTAKDTATTATRVDDNRWHLLSVTKTGTSKIEVFIDTVLLGSDTSLSASGSLANSDTFYLGVDGDGSSNGWVGFLDDFKVYRSGRTQDQLKTDFVKGSPLGGSSASLGGPGDGGSSAFLSDGLVAYWKMDEATWSGTLKEVKDSSGNGNDGQAQGAASAMAYPVGGKFGNGGYFDGVDDYIKLSPNIQTFSTSTSGFTLSAWIYWTTNGTSNQIPIMSDNQTNGNIHNIFFIHDGNGDVLDYNAYNHNQSRRILTDGSGELQSNLSIPLNKWTFVSLVYNRIKGQYTFYKNDQSYVSGTGLIEDDVDGVRSIGAAANSTRLFPGSMDEVRLYNRALSPAEVQQLYNWAPGPVGEWKFNEHSGVTAYDSSGYGNDLTLVKSPIFTSAINDTGLTFNGTSNYASYTDPGTTSLDLPGNLTVESWVKWNSLKDYGVILEKAAGGTMNTMNYGLWSYANQQISCFIGNGSDHNSIYIANLTTGVWHHLACTADGSHLIFYLDGQAHYSNQTITPAANNSPFYISQPSYSLDGIVDDARVYNYARTQKQIIEDMNSGHPAPGSPVGSSVIKWDLDENSGSVAHNGGSGGSAYDGSLSGTTWATAGKVGSGLRTPVSTDYVSAGDVGFVDGISGFTASLWLNPQALATSKAILSKSNFSSQNSFAIITDPATTGEIRVYLAGSASDTSNYLTTSGLGLQNGTWAHLAVVYDASASSKLKVYKNGLPVTGSVTGTIPNNLVASSTSLFKLGASDSGSYTALNAIYDEVHFSLSALTQNQIAQTMNQNASAVMGLASTSSDGRTASASATRADCVPGSTDPCTPPIAEYSFDDPTVNGGLTVVDLSGNNNPGTWAGTGHHWATGKFSQAGQFNGVDDKVTISAANVINLSSGTVSLWFNSPMKQTGSSGSYFMFSHPGSATNSRIYIDFSSDGTTFGTMLGATTISATTPTQNQWHHVELTWNGTTAATYLDGKNITTNATFGGLPNQVANVYLGSLSGAAEYFNGLIDNIKIYNYARTPAQIAWDYNRGAPLARYDLDECTGSVIHDASTNGYTGTIHPNTGRSVGTCSSGTPSEMWNGGTSGKYGNSLAFDGAGDYVSFGTALTNIQTVSLWVKPAATTVNLADFDGGSHTLSLSSGTVTATGWSAPVVYVDGRLNGLVSDTNWHLVTVTTATGFNTTSSFKLGVIGSTYYAGQIDDLRLYNYALTPLQIVTLNNQNSAVRFGP